MNWRLRFVSFFVCSIFTLLAFWYYKYYVSPRPHGVIVFVVPGLTPELISHYRALDPVRASFIEERATDFAVVDNAALLAKGLDSASIMNYFSTGVVGAGGQLGLDSSGERLDTLLYQAQRSGRLAGIISTDSVISPHVSAFYAHTTKAWDKEELSRQLFDSANLNTIMGGGASHLDQYSAGNPRDLLKEADLNGYDLVRDHEELDETAVWIWRNTLKTRRLLGLFSPETLPYFFAGMDDPEEKAGLPPPLQLMVRKSIQCLQFNLNGYLLIVHEGRIARACTENNYPQILEQIRQLDKTMSEARNYAGQNTLILLYSPYEVSGLAAKTPGEVPTGSQAPLPQTTWRNREKIPVTLEYPGPFRPEMEVKALHGWASVYYITPTNLPGFVTPGDLSAMLSAEF